MNLQYNRALVTPCLVQTETSDNAENIIPAVKQGGGSITMGCFLIPLAGAEKLVRVE